ncbi:MAG: signal recognition particle-docking protein FtsY [Candidatus Aenigmatarchaeota archaeon]
MFGFLKKKIKESIDNISKAVSKKPVETKTEEKKEEAEKIDNTVGTYSEDKFSESGVVAEKSLEDETTQGYPEAAEKPINIEVEVKKELEQIETAEEIKPHVETKTEGKKEGFLGRITKKFAKQITEVTIKEDDIGGVLDDLKIGLMENDVALDVAEKICVDIEKSIVGKSVKRSKIEDAIKESMRKSVSEILAQDYTDIVDFVKTHEKPVLIIFAGFNGAGKTTTLARVGKYLKDRSLECVFAAGDSFRAASIEQIQVHGDRLGIKVIKHGYGADSAAVVFDAMKYAIAHNIDVVLADTAGRTHVNANLMDELKKVCRVNKPAMKILILDSLTGNDIVQQAQRFDEAIGIDAVVFTKVDVYERGGAILSASHTIKKPILFLGVGQDYDDLEKFDKDKIVDMLLA